MDTRLVEDIENEVRRYLSGENSLDQLSTWLILAARNIHHADDTHAEYLVRRIETSISMFNNGFLDEEDVIQDLSALLGIRYIASSPIEVERSHFDISASESILVAT